MLVARKSSDETKSGETIGAQIDHLVRYCEASGHRPRIVMVVLNLSGRAHFEARHDFTDVFESFERGEIDWVVYRAMDRVARSMTWTALFVHYLREYGIGLHIAMLNSEIDLNNHYALSTVWVLAMTAEGEWAASGERMQTALSMQLRDAGKMWGSSGGFGFTRDSENFVVVDPTPWGVVKMIHEWYEKAGSLDGLRALLLKEKVGEFSKALLKKILSDQKYLSGEFRTVEAARPEGYRVDFVAIPDPISQHLWDRNQLLLRVRRGKRTQTPEGTFLLRGIPVYHARCMDPDDPGASTDLLACRWTGSAYRYHHRSAEGSKRDYAVPEGCYGYTVAAEVIDGAVIRGLRRLLTNDQELHRAIALGRGGVEPTESGGTLTDAGRKALKRQKSRLQQHADGLWQEHHRKVGQGERSDRNFLQQELEQANLEIASTEAQLKLDEQLRRRKPAQEPVDPDVLALLKEEPPEDDETRMRRWAIVQQLVSSVTVRDREDGLEIEIAGPLVPEDSDFGWDPVEAIAEDGSGNEDLRPSVPQPFATSAGPSRSKSSLVASLRKLDRIVFAAPVARARLVTRASGADGTGTDVSRSSSLRSSAAKEGRRVMAATFLTTRRLASASAPEGASRMETAGLSTLRALPDFVRDSPAGRSGR